MSNSLARVRIFSSPNMMGFNLSLSTLLAEVFNLSALTCSSDQLFSMTCPGAVTK